MSIRSESINGEFDSNIFGNSMNGLPHIDMYRSWVAPDLYPGQKQPVLKNWHPEDLAAYCGGEYTIGVA